MDTYKQIEKVFLHSPDRLVSTFAVLKVDQPNPTPAKRSKPPGNTKANSKPRTVCVTVARRIGRPGFKATLHVLKRVGGRGEFEIRKSRRLKHLVSLEARHTSVDDHPVCGLTFRVSGVKAKRKEVLTYECATEEEQWELLGVVYSFCRDHEGVVPKLLGVSRADLGVYGEGEDDESDVDVVDDDDDNGRVSASDGERDAERDVERDGTGEAASTPKPSSAPLLPSQAIDGTSKTTTKTAPAPNANDKTPTRSKRRQSNNNDNDNGNIEAIRADILLDAIADGASSLEDACVMITRERRALDDANMHELLELASVSRRIHSDVLSAVSDLDDLEDAFHGQFDATLRHVPKSVVEESSRYLQHHRSTNAHDVKLEALIAMTTIDPGLEHVLIDSPISMKHLDRIRAAFLKLQGSMGALDSENQDGNVRAVRDARQHLRNIHSRFIVKAVGYFDGELNKAASGGGQHVYVQLHEKLAAMTPILELLCAADAGVAKERVVAYVEMTKKLLVREAKDCRDAIVRIQKDGGKVSGIGKEVLKAEATLLEHVRAGDAVERREVLSNIKGTDVSALFANTTTKLVPRVANEIAVIADLVEKANLTSHVAGDFAAASFVAAIEPFFSGCVSSVKSSRGLALLDMTGSVSSSQLKLSSSKQSELSAMLQRVLDAAAAEWESFAAEMHEAIRSRGKEMRSRSDIRVMPFVVNTEYIAGRAEAIVADWVAKGGSTKTVTTSTGARLRGMADGLYSLVLPEIFKTIELFARDHEKHSDRIRIENYAFLRTGLQALGAKSSGVLKSSSDEAANRRDSAIKAYVSRALTQSLLLAPLAGSEQLAGDELRAVFADPSAVETALRFLTKTVQRDFGGESYLVRVVWDRVHARIVQALESLANDGEMMDRAVRVRGILANLKL